MLSSSTTLSDSCTSSPIYYVDNIISSYLIDDSTNYPTSYYHSPSPLIYNNEIDSFGDFITTHELSIIQQSMLAHNNETNNKNCSINVPNDSSILDSDTKMVSNNNGGGGGGGDHESDLINGIVEDNNNSNNNNNNNNNNNGEMNHNFVSNSTTTTTTTTTTTSHTNNRVVVKIKKKRSSNKDRHSKIRTAHGLRDRRMRLSLQVAQPFFKLQDMLGYDKASATVEWLLMQSKPAIDELLQGNNNKQGRSPPSGVTTTTTTTTTTTKCTTTTLSSNSDVDCEVESTAIEQRKATSSVGAKEDQPKPKRKRTTKEERKVARERAKRRTLEKMQSRGTQQFKEATNKITNSFRNHYHQSLDVSQNVPSYRISAQENIMEGPL